MLGAYSCPDQFLWELLKMSFDYLDDTRGLQVLQWGTCPGELLFMLPLDASNRRWS
jgi:hypothetical protein